MSEKRTLTDGLILTETVSVAVGGTCDGCGFKSSTSKSIEFSYKNGAGVLDFYNYVDNKRNALRNAEMFAHVELMGQHSIHRSNPVNLKGRSFPCGKKTSPKFTKP